MRNTRRNGGKLVIPAMAIMLAIMPGLLIFRNFESDLLYLALLFSCVSILCVGFFGRKFGLLSWRTGIPLFYFVYFLLIPVFIDDVFNNSWELPVEYIEDGLWYATVGILSFAVGSMVFSLVRFKASGIDRSKTFNLVYFFPVTMLLVFVGALSRVISVFEGYSSVGMSSASSASSLAGIYAVFSFFLPVGMLAAWRNYFESRDRRFYLLGMAALVSMVLAGVFSNSKGLILSPILMVAILKYGYDGRLPARSIVIIGVLFIFFAFPLISSFREIQQVSAASDSRYELLQFYLDYMFSMSWMNYSGSTDAISSLGRGLLLFFSRIVRDTGHSIPFFDGDTYIHALSAFVPRFIYPDKLGNDIGNMFARIYGVVWSGDEVTNVSPTLMGEFYANFGAAGLLAGMFLMGAVAVFVDKCLMADRKSWLMPILMASIGWQESVVGQSFLPFIKDMLILFLFLALVRFVLNILRVQVRERIALTIPKT